MHFILSKASKTSWYTKTVCIMQCHRASSNIISNHSFRKSKYSVTDQIHIVMSWKRFKKNENNLFHVKSMTKKMLPQTWTQLGYKSTCYLLFNCPNLELYYIPHTVLNAIKHAIKTNALGHKKLKSPSSHKQQTQKSRQWANRP